MDGRPLTRMNISGAHYNKAAPTRQRHRLSAYGDEMSSFSIKHASSFLQTNRRIGGLKGVHTPSALWDAG
ncbi:hypothetical protein CVT26_008616 [Gymnopilus dilepis]|uniref:Uncharacterized protein n=1 Tax=Gymnopilus dilepis TaxID=231916 RepID=A0A409XXU5_9AGAR|nr:hypothetical protein CVT26_008616 [Gymnopilus dilepis]